MPNNNMKNIVVLKNLPSNLVDEAIVILKSNKYARKLQYIEKNRKIEYKDTRNDNDYIIKEAESVITSYINKVERNKKLRKFDNNIEIKNKKIKTYSIIVSIILLLGLIKGFYG